MVWRGSGHPCDGLLEGAELMDGDKLIVGGTLIVGALDGSSEMVGFGETDGAALGCLLTKGLVFLILMQVVVPFLIGRGSMSRPLRPSTFSKPMVTGGRI